ncbi:histidine kinase/DNA gyrase B/HSP90-like ATPase [Rhizobium sp. PP-WC-1G-195]|nr:histidine kinase/DNA gyrase B/HSP90-like ATPase [Rhizobium sp. PP-WC-1G-195]
MADETIETETRILNWGEDAPRGGKAVLNRIIKEKATVPLFFAQTLIQSLRDVGYNNTTSALCEHVDNSIQSGASEIRVYFRQSGSRDDSVIDAVVYDNGSGMAPTTLKVAMAFGGSMNFGARQGIARFGMGMKTAALSMSPTLDVYSWQEPSAYYNMTLDVEAIGRERTNLIGLPDPSLVTELPDDLADVFRLPMVFPKNKSEQALLVSEKGYVEEALGSSGTIVYMQACDRLTYRKVQTLVDHAVKEMGRVYRRYIARGLNLYVNNRLVEASDPTYSLAAARHNRYLEEGVAKNSRLLLSKEVAIPVRENSSKTVPIIVKMYRLPVEDWYSLPRKTLKNDLQVFNSLTVSILRNDREVFAGPMPKLTTRHSVTHWYRIQIDFSGELDEAFGVAANKQGVRLKGYVEDTIKLAIREDISTLNGELKRFQAAQLAARNPSQPSPSEARAMEADAFQQKSLEANLTDEEKADLDANLRGLASTLRRQDETEDQAFERVSKSRYIIDLKHDEYWPFYDVRHKFGRIILTINTAHPFFTDLYEPLRKLETANETEEGDETPLPAEDDVRGPLAALELLLLSLARTQSRIAMNNEDASKILDMFRREWSETYRIQMTA